jgi:hypothetical protein
MTRVPVLWSVSEALAAELPDMPFGDGKGPLSDPDDIRSELSAAGFTRVEVVEHIHSFDRPDIDALWASLRRSFAPLVLLEHRIGSEAFAPIAARMQKRLRDRHQGALHIEMPAWIGIAHKARTGLGGAP